MDLIFPGSILFKPRSGDAFPGLHYWWPRFQGVQTPRVLPGLVAINCEGRIFVSLSFVSFLSLLILFAPDPLHFPGPSEFLPLFLPLPSLPCSFFTGTSMLSLLRLWDHGLGRNPLLWGWWGTGTGCPEKLRMPTWLSAWTHPAATSCCKSRGTESYKHCQLPQRSCDLTQERERCNGSGNLHSTLSLLSALPEGLDLQRAWATRPSILWVSCGCCPFCSARLPVRSEGTRLVALVWDCLQTENFNSREVWDLGQPTSVRAAPCPGQGQHSHHNEL